MKKCWIAFTAILCAVNGSLAFAALTPRLEDGLAITQPRIVETIEERASGEGIGVGYYLDPSGRSIPDLSNLYLSQLSTFKPIVDSINKEIADYKKGGHSVGVGMQYDTRLFDTNFLTFDGARFALVGVIFRPDRAFVNSQTCGETRMIYRLAYTAKINGGKNQVVSSRLPMTINLVLNTKSPNSPLTCQEIARRWKNLDLTNKTISSAADEIMGSNGPLAPELRDRGLIKQLEINLQMARQAAAIRPDFGGEAVYLMKVYRIDPKTRSFVDSTMDNQVDRTQASAFFSWLFEKPYAKDRLSELDRGTIVIPPQFLARRAYTLTPGEMSRTLNHPLAGTISDNVIQQHLSEQSLDDLVNIKSVEGFKRRLTDVSCTGCHQTRAIGGFHFMGEDPYRFSLSDAHVPRYPGDAVVVPASAHFFADLVRRREVLEQMVKGETPDHTTGFASRPEEHVKNLVATNGKGIFNGWGAHCYTGSDPSFKAWTCSEGTRCLVLREASIDPNMGVCVSKSGQQIGDPTQIGSVKMSGHDWFSDLFVLKQTLPVPTGPSYLNSQQKGGFPGGSLRLTSCDPAMMKKHPEAACGGLPSGAGGFNECIGQPNESFDDCLKKHTQSAGLRRCSREEPCRDDFICIQGDDQLNEDAGVCEPPYFLFEFRVDGHPVSFSLPK